MASGALRRIRLAYEPSELFRRYFITTVFDATFVVLGIVTATALLPGPTAVNVRLTLATLGAAAIAIGVSTGVSVYEAERVEGQIRMAKLERAMLSELSDTDVSRSLRTYRTVISLLNFGAPLFVFGITALPLFLDLILGWPGPREAAEASIAIAIAFVFVAGLALGRMAGASPWRQAGRMTLAAVLTFLLLVAVQLLLA